MDTPALSLAWSAFDRLSPGAGAQLRSLGRPAAFEAGAPIFMEGRETPFLGALASGRVALRLRVPELGERVTIATVEPGDLLGWSALVAPFRSTVDAVAAERTGMLTFGAIDLRARVASDPAFAAELLPLVAETVSRRLTTSWQQLLDVFAPAAREPW